MIASLPMYWRAENAAQWQAFWHIVQDHADRAGLPLPDATPPEEIAGPWTDHWLRNDLVLSMTCGLPFRSILRDRVTYVGTVGFGLDAPAGHYYSQVIVSRETFDRAQRAGPDHALPDRPVLAFNAADSQSGWAVAHSAPPFSAPLIYGGYLQTGSHAASLAAVAEGRADLAFVDAVTWRLLDRFDPLAARVCPLGQSITTPALPLITAKGTDPEPLQRVLRAAIAAFDPDDPLAMGGPLSLSVLDDALYHAQPLPPPVPAG